MSRRVQVFIISPPMEIYPQWPMLGGARGVGVLIAPPDYNYPVGNGVWY
jgi:hypothetical protein